MELQEKMLFFGVPVRNYKTNCNLYRKFVIPYNQTFRVARNPGFSAPQIGVIFEKKNPR